MTISFNATIQGDDFFKQAIHESIRDTLGGFANPAHWFDMEDYVKRDEVAEMLSERTQTASDAIDEAVTEALDDRLINAIEEALDDNVLTDKIEKAVEHAMENLDMDDAIRDHFRYGGDPSEYMDMSDYALDARVSKLLERIEKLEETITRLTDALAPKPAPITEQPWPGRVSWETPPGSETTKEDDINA